MDQLTHRLHPQSNHSSPILSHCWRGCSEEKVCRHSSVLISLWRSPHKTTLVPPRLAPNIPKRTTSKSCGSIQLRPKRDLVLRPISISLYQNATKSKSMASTMTMRPHMWSPAIRGQPICDATNNHGKIICCNKKTVDFWVKYISLASTMVGNIKLKAWD